MAVGVRDASRPGRPATTKGGQERDAIEHSQGGRFWSDRSFCVGFDDRGLVDLQLGILDLELLLDERGILATHP